MTFRHAFETETKFDGGVLEIQSGSSPFLDIQDAGGVFLAGPYTDFINTVATSPIAGRAAWTGTSNGYITSAFKMPPALAGQNVTLRWRMATDKNIGSVGWAVDTVRIEGGCGGVPTNVPWGLQAITRGNHVSFSWRPPLNAAATSYLLDVSLDGGATFQYTFPMNATSFEADGPDITIHARVRAVLSGGGLSAPTNLVTVPIGSAARPATPTNLLSSVNASAINLAWDLPSEGGTVSTVRLEIGDFSGHTTILALPPGTTTFAASGVPAGTYYSRVRQRGLTSFSEVSNEVRLTVPGGACAPPAPPTNLTANKTGNVVTLSWGLAPVGTAAPSSWRLEAGTGNGLANIGFVSLAQRSLTVPVPPGTYFLRVSAGNSCGTSAKTADISFTIP